MTHKNLANLSMQFIAVSEEKNYQFGLKMTSLLEKQEAAPTIGGKQEVA